MANKSGWWNLETGDVELDDADLEHIADLIRDGYTSGEICETENDEDTTERIEELQEKRTEFIFNEALYSDENPSWGEVAEAEGKAEKLWNETDDGKELAKLLTEMED
jgi:hypothetical protein